MNNIPSLTGPSDVDSEQAARWQGYMDWCMKHMFPGRRFADLTDVEQDQVRQAAHESAVYDDYRRSVGT